jgi:DNA-binding response OmpR family regulator
MGASIFVVDSSPAVRRMVEEISIREGYEVMGFQDGPKALEAARHSSPSLILADFHLEDMTFSGFCKEISKLDNLSETLVISLVDPSDKLDESKLRALGVRAFLKKPFQREQLLETINGILNDDAEKKSAPKAAKPRTWPPIFTETNDEDDASTPNGSADDAPQDETEKEPTAMSPLPSHTANSSPSVAASTMEGGEALMKGLFNHLLQSVIVQTDRKMTDLLPSAISREVAGQLVNAVRTAVQTEVAKQLTEALAPERLQTAMRDLIQEELRRQSQAHLAGVEPTVRQAVSDLAPAILEQSVEKLLGDLAEGGVKKHLPEALQTHLEMIDQLVKKEVERVAANCARQAADEIVHQMAKDPIQQAVQRIVPEVADAQVRAEITRLTSAG